MDIVEPRVLGAKVIAAVSDASTAAAKWTRDHQSQIEIAVGYTAYAAGAVVLFKATTLTAMGIGAAGVIGGGALACRGLSRPKA